MGKNCSVECNISCILRVAIAALFAVAAAGKFMGGVDGVVTQITGMFKDSFLPSGLVALYARLLPWAEAAIAIWLITGVRLKEAWIFTAAVLISLAFGLAVAKAPMVADLYTYILIACIGLYFSEHDKCTIEKFLKK